jgi:hypothetical protein
MEKKCMFDIKIAIANMKNNRAPGDDEVTVDMIKPVKPVSVQRICGIMRKICHSNKIPKDWKKHERVRK